MVDSHVNSPPPCICNKTRSPGKKLVWCPLDMECCSLDMECDGKHGEFLVHVLFVPCRHAAMAPLVGDSVEVVEAKRAVQR